MIASVTVTESEYLFNKINLYIDIDLKMPNQKPRQSLHKSYKDTIPQRWSCPLLDVNYCTWAHRLSFHSVRQSSRSVSRVFQSTVASSAHGYTQTLLLLFCMSSGF
ncbi:hypothetical protein L1887_17698 [Cichorium endivia]|nr:hypothetical protein L1887_17698 [Cichorium endivia]